MTDTVVQPASTSAGAPSPAALREVLDGRWGWVRDGAREQLADPAVQPKIGESLEDQRARTSAALEHLADSGHSRYGFPTAYGGEGDIGASITAFEMMAMGDLSVLVKAGVQWGLFGGAILQLGTERHHRRYLPDVISLALPGCFAMTESGHGSDVASLHTTATYDVAAGEFVIDTPDELGKKDYIGNAARDGKLAVVFAQLVVGGESQGVHAVLVPVRDEEGRPMPGVEIEDDGVKAGLNGVDNGRFSFHGVRVPRENLLNRFGDVTAEGEYVTEIPNSTRRFFTMLGTLIQGRISVAGGAAAAAKVALEIAVRYGSTRRQFDAPGAEQETLILDYRAHQRKLLPRLAKSYALHFAQAALVEKLHDVSTDSDADDPRRRELEAQAAGIKALSTWHATDTIQACREACGGAGYLSENRLPALKADTDVFTTFEGDNTVLLQLVGKELLTAFKDHFGSLDTLGTVRFVADTAMSSILERLSARKVMAGLFTDSEGSVSEPATQADLFAYREEHLIDGVARRLRKAAGAADPFAVFNDAQPHLLLMAEAHIERTVLEAFDAAVSSVSDEATRALLARVRDLYASATIEANRGWFQEHGRLSAAQSKAVVAHVDELCGDLRPYAQLLVDGFGIPRECVDVPITRASWA